jgi:hypothetical protein
MIISDSRRFVFVHTMKTAGDSITVALQPHLASHDFVLKNDFQAWRRRVTGQNPARYAALTKHSPANDIRQTVGPDGWGEYYTFAFVRHPVQRALSLYHYVATKAERRESLHVSNAWYLMPLGKKDDPREWPAMAAYTETGTFSGFIRHPAMASAAGLQSQTEFLCDADGNLLVDFVGKFEQLDEDMAKVQDAIGLPRVPLDQRNVSDRSSGQPIELSADDRTYLAKRYEDDLERFGYTL